MLFALQTPSFEESLLVTTINGGRRIQLQERGSSSFSLMGRSKKGIVCCKKQSNTRGTSNPNKSNQEEIMSLLKRIQSSISKGGSRGVEETKNRNDSSENESLTKAILDVLEKPRKKTEGDSTSVKEPPSSFAKRAPIPSASGPRETMKLAELKEVAKNRGIKGYSKLRKSELLELIRSS